MKNTVNYIWLCIIFTVCSGCAATHDWPKVSPGADNVYNFNSNIEQTVFYVDENKLATGRRVKVLMDDLAHTVKAAPPGYTPKEEYIQPPYNSYSALNFIFMLGDRINTEETPSISQKGLSTQTVSQGFVLPFALPKTKQSNNDSVAVVIGNRNYRKYSPDVPDVDFAHNDADLIYQFLKESIGVREGNIIFIKDATQAQMLSTFGSADKPNGKLANWIRPQLSDVYVYYSGHGAPGLKDGQGYLLPVDSDPSTVDINGYPVNLLIANLGKLPARSVTVILDACFSGSSNNGAIVRNASPAMLKVSQPSMSNHENMVLVTATGPPQVASWDKESRLGLLTRYFVEGLSGKADMNNSGNHDGKISVQELKTYLSDEISYQARRSYGREQNPEVSGAADFVLYTLN